MKKRVYICGILFFLLTCVTGCQKSEKYQRMEDSKNETLPIYKQNDKELQKESALQTMEEVYESDYRYEEWGAGEIGEAGGIVILGDTFLVSDRKNDCIFQLDKEGNITAQSGTTGSDKGQFLSPAALAVYEENVYVLDTGNHRVQVLDNSLNYVREIPLKNVQKEDPDYEPQSIAVTGEGVFVTGFSLENPVIDCYTGEKREETGRNFIGSISAYDNQIYGINSMGCYYDKSSDSFGAQSTAPAWFMNVNKDKLEKVCKLPYGLYITAFLADDTGIVCVSCAGESIYRLNVDGEYEETIVRISGLADAETPQIVMDDERSIYIAIPEMGVIYRCYRDGRM